MTEETVARFWAKVIRHDGACWGWTAAKNRAGYGWVKDDVRSQLAHRVSWVLAHGPIPDGMCVLHRCDNPPCVNPEHLFLGTRVDNVADMMHKGRGRKACAEAHWKAKLTSDEIRGIRAAAAAGALQRDIGRAHGLHQTTVSRIVLRKTWTTVESATENGH